VEAYSILKRGVNTFSRILYKIVEVLTVLILLTVVVVVSLEVFLRYILNRGFPWTNEVGTLLLQYLTFASMVLGVKYKLHISLLVFYNRMPMKAQWILDKFADVCILFFGFAICFFGYGLTTRTWRFTLPATQWPQGLTYIICVVAGIIIIYEAIVSLFGLNKKDEKWESSISDMKDTEMQESNIKEGKSIV